MKKSSLKPGTVDAVRPAQAWERLVGCVATAATFILAATTATTAPTTFTRIMTGPVATDVASSVGASWGDYDNDGDEDIFVANWFGENTVLRVIWDATFTKIVTGEVVSDAGNSRACAWGDYDNDGYPDLAVMNLGFDGFYHNNHDGTFRKVTVAGSVGDGRYSYGGVWGDYDNDGYLDLFVANANGNDILYHNQGDGTFGRVLSGADIINDGVASRSAGWGDYDNDGNLDLIVAAQYYSLLYRNKGDGTFKKILDGVVSEGAGYWTSCAWADYDKDGHLDLFLTGERNTPNTLYRNQGDGTFRNVTSVSGIGLGNSQGCAWGDYDNDGYLDLFVANSGEPNMLYHNNGNGTFARISNGTMGSDSGLSSGCAWGDYDNDGYLDLFVANDSGRNFLYHNNGDGSFTRVTQGAPANEQGRSHGCGWADYDRDGQLDLFVATEADNYLYRNNESAQAN